MRSSFAVLFELRPAVIILSSQQDPKLTDCLKAEGMLLKHKRPDRSPAILLRRVIMHNPRLSGTLCPLLLTIFTVFWIQWRRYPTELLNPSWRL